MHPESYHKEPEVTKEAYQPGCISIPPRPIPGEGVDLIEPDFNDDTENRTDNRDEGPVGDPQNLCFGIRQ